MVSPNELNRVDAIILAIMCKKLSQDESQPKDIRETARKFKEEWLQLVETETSKKQNGKQFDAIKEEVAELKARMVVFLAPLV
ncbi:MAG TPA: hypothetical protein VFT65_04590 [Candidatus Angelobacter sp.]|nr:hypothetical protein [Candidatus Angelobacter sp.]